MADDDKINEERIERPVFNLDNVLKELGEFGKYQLYVYILISVPVLFAACNNGNYIFTARDLMYRCRIPECEPDNSTILETEWLKYAMPSSTDPRRCTRYAPVPDGNVTDLCTPNIFNISHIMGCDDFVFGSHESIVSEFGIQCEKWKRTLVGTIHSAGLLFALPLVSFVSDRFGRRIAFVGSAFLAGVFGLIRSFSTNYTMFVIFEFLEPVLGSGVYSSGFILGMELVGPRRRVLGSTILCMFYSFGAMVLGMAAWLFPYWRTLLRVIYGPSLLFISYYWLIQESVRWLISKGQYEKAVKALKKAAKINGVTLTEKSMENLYSNIEIKNETEMKELNKEEVAEKQVSPYRQVLKSSIILRRLLKCSFWWITCTFVYYGLSINSVGLSGNIYLNYVLVSCVELPAYLTNFLVLERFGRKPILCMAFLCSGCACIVFPLVPANLGWLSLILYLFGKYFITMAFGALYVYTSELFPTMMRHSLLGTCSMVGRIGSILAPQTPLLTEFVPGLTSYLFGSIAIFAGLLMLTSPETLNIKLPDTIEEAENIQSRRVTKDNL